TSFSRDWSSDVCSSDLRVRVDPVRDPRAPVRRGHARSLGLAGGRGGGLGGGVRPMGAAHWPDLLVAARGRQAGLTAMAEFYLQIKHFHIAIALLSGAVFAVRGAFLLRSE